MKPIKLTVISDSQCLSRIREMISASAADVNVEKSVLGQIILAVDETCSNIIRHTYQCEPDQKIHIEIRVTKKEFIVTIKDEGKPFDITTLEPRDVSEIKPGGLGVYIIKEVMDSVSYSRTKDGLNLVTLVKKLDS